MGRSDPSRWTPDELSRLVEMASQKGATLKMLGEHYGISAAAVATVLRQTGANLELSKRRKQWRLEEAKEERRRILSEILIKANGSISTAARIGNYGRSTIEIWTRQLFAKDEIERMIKRPACIECGKPVVSIAPHAKVCSAECKIARKNKLTARRRKSSWQLWVKRDYDELMVTLKLHGGNVNTVAKIMGISRHAVHAAVTRWGMREELDEMRRISRDERVTQAAELIKTGISVTRAALRVGIYKKYINAELTRMGYSHLIDAQKCVCCGKLFQRGKVQDRSCSEECRTNLMRARWKQVRLRKAENKRKQQKAKGVILQKELIKRSKHL